MHADDEIKQHLKNLRSLRNPNGLFLAAPKSAQTNYHKVWLRDCVYETMAFESTEDWEAVTKTYHALLDIFHKHAEKIYKGAKQKPADYRQYICSRYDPVTLDEVWEDSNKQSDAIGTVLFKLAEFETRGKSMLRSVKDKRIVEALIDYLVTLEYWRDPDSGMWEQDEDLRASSVGAVLAALKQWQAAGGMDIDEDAITQGETVLLKLLPRETSTRTIDLAQLSLMYPLNIVDEKMARRILDNITGNLEREKGLIRFKFDRYYNSDQVHFTEEAEWCFGFSWLAIIYSRLGEPDKARRYLEKAANTITPDGKIPELYLSHTNKPNTNIPLGWAESLYIVALNMLKV